MAGAFDPARVNAALAGTMFFGKFHHFASIDSTNTYALAQAQAGAEAGQVYLADEQTAGRGRGGHQWHSQPEQGLYVTVLVRPSPAMREVLHLSLVAGVATSLAIAEATGVRVDLRWPNDIVVPQPGRSSRKAGGILTEAASSADGTVRYAAIGIGLNLNQVQFPSELAELATSLQLASGSVISREMVAIALLRHLHAELLLQAASPVAQTLERFTERSSWAVEKRIRVDEGDGYTGVTVGLTAEGLLRVRCDDGTERVVRNGGVREVVPAAPKYKGTHASGH